MSVVWFAFAVICVAAAIAIPSATRQPVGRHRKPGRPKRWPPWHDLSPAARLGLWLRGLTAPMPEPDIDEYGDEPFDDAMRNNYR